MDYHITIHLGTIFDVSCPLLHLSILSADNTVELVRLAAAVVVFFRRRLGRFVVTFSSIDAVTTFSGSLFTNGVDAPSVSPDGKAGATALTFE